MTDHQSGSFSPVSEQNSIRGMSHSPVNAQNSVRSRSCSPIKEEDEQFSLEIEEPSSDDNQLYLANIKDLNRPTLLNLFCSKIEDEHQQEIMKKSLKIVRLKEPEFWNMGVHIFKFATPDMKKVMMKKVPEIEKQMGKKLFITDQEILRKIKTNIRRPKNVTPRSLLFMNKVNERKQRLLLKAQQQYKKLRNHNFADNVSPENISKDTYGLSREYLNSLDIKLPLHNRVFICNLNFIVDETMLRELFSMAGIVVQVTIIKKKDGESVGKARIEYDHPVEAVQAIAMFNGQSYYDREIQVKMDREPCNKYLPPGLKGIGPGLGPNGSPLRGIRNTVEVTPLKQMILELSKKELKPNTLNTNVSNQLNALDLNTIMNMNMFNQSASNPLFNSLFNPTQNVQNLQAMQNTQSMGTDLVATVALQNQNMPGLVQNVASFAQNIPAMTQNIPGIAQNMPTMAHNVPPMAGNNSTMAQTQNMPGTNQNMFQHQREWRLQSNTPMSNVGVMSNTLSDYKSEFHNIDKLSANDSYKGKRKDQDKTSFDQHSKMMKVSDMVVFNNLPSSVTNRVLSQKMQEVGDVKFVELTGHRRAIVRFNYNQDAERCVRLFDQSKVDGRSIEVNFL